MRHRPELDGIRGIAILGVLFVHAGIAPGGAFGVTVFFVLSGYLITLLLVAEQDRSAGRLDFRAFYRRRAARLIPALVLALGAVVVLSGAQSNIVLPVLLAAGYVMNFAIPWLGFDRVAAAGFTWSLALEEQFYLAWPFVLRRISADRRRELARNLIMVALALALIRGWLYTRNPVAAVYAPERADALMIGSALALAPKRLPTWVGWAGLSTVLAAFYLGTVGGPTSVLLGHTVVAFAVAAVIATADRLSLRTLLSSPVLTHLGRISYSLYLWNSLLLAATAERGWSVYTPHFLAWWLPASFFAAEVSTFLIEAPLRRRFAHRREAGRRRTAISTAPA